MWLDWGRLHELFQQLHVQLAANSVAGNDHDQPQADTDSTANDTGSSHAAAAATSGTAKASCRRPQASCIQYSTHRARAQHLCTQKGRRQFCCAAALHFLVLAEAGQKLLRFRLLRVAEYLGDLANQVSTDLIIDRG